MKILAESCEKKERKKKGKRKEKRVLERLEDIYIKSY